MRDFSKVTEAINSYIRPQTFPIAVRMLSPKEELPKKSKRPVRDLGGPIAVCQAISISRRYGWTMTLGKEDMACPPGSIVLGFLPPKTGFLDGSAKVPNWLRDRDKELRRKVSQAFAKFEYQKYSHMVCAPLERAEFEPQVIIVFGNPAQVMRLVQSVVYTQGEPVTSVSFGANACADYIVKPILTDQCQAVLPGGGDRVFALTQDHEMAFATPLSKIDAVIQGLKGTYEAGMRYPVPQYLRFIPEFPSEYKELMTYLKQEGEE